MDHVLWKGLYADRVRTNWCLGTKDQSCNHFQGKCIEIHFMKRKQERQTGVVTDLARQVKGCCQTYAKQLLGKVWRESSGGEEG